METYNNLSDAKQILYKARLAVTDGTVNPAWNTLYNAGEYLNKQAAAVYAKLRGQEVAQ